VSWNNDRRRSRQIVGSRRKEHHAPKGVGKNLGAMKQYASNRAFFADVADLAMRIEVGGCPGAAEEMRKGLRCINGLTDGWALLMESLERVTLEFGTHLTSEQNAELKDMFDVTSTLVYRK
jgi:hypothetical protein